MTDSVQLNENQLVKLAKEGNQAAFVSLLARFTPIIHSKCKRFYKCGLESEDFFQEGALGLFCAVKSFDIGNNASFYTYAGICIENRLISAFKSASCKKHLPLDNYLPLNQLSHLEAMGEIDPEEKYIELESLKNLNNLFLEILSEKEYNVLNLYLQGYSYSKIAQSLKISQKSVDNAVQRIKRKIKNSVFDK